MVPPDLGKRSGARGISKRQKKTYSSGKEMEGGRFGENEPPEAEKDVYRKRRGPLGFRT